MSKVKYEFVDALRGIAIILVIGIHSLGDGLPKQLNTLLGHLQSGVQLFFVASAFTLFLSMNNRREESGPTRNFFIRRFFRIAPMYYLGILFYSLSGILATAHHVPTPSSVVSTFLFYNCILPEWLDTAMPGGWSISVEFLFYLLIPILFVKITTLNRAVIFFMATVLFNLIFQYILYHSGIPSDTLRAYTYYSLPNHLPVFACGIICYFLLVKKDYNIKAWQVFALSGILALRVIFGQSVPVPIYYGIFYGLILIGLYKQNFYLLVNPITKFFGKVSFSAYVLHFAVLHYLSYFNLSFFSSPTVNFFILLIISTVITGAISYITYLTIEMPGQYLGKRLIRKLEGGKVIVKELRA